MNHVRKLSIARILISITSNTVLIRRNRTGRLSEVHQLSKISKYSMKRLTKFLFWSRLKKLKTKTAEHYYKE